ncbi:MAG TPA: M28 family peptidase [Telluria sp.]|jgi:hypothetical protein
MPTLPHHREKSSLAGLSVAALALCALAWLSLQANRTPAPRPADAAPAEFSAARALPMLQQLARSPRPVANEANGRARASIIERLLALGLEVQAQAGWAQQTLLTNVGVNDEHRVTPGIAHNILVRIKGSAIDRRRRPALLVAAHYDSSIDRLGAADAALPVAAMLETLRALRFGAPPDNDVIFLFADADKAGQLGARAFAEQHPWARTVGLVLQFDVIGNRGPLLLTGSRGGNGKLIDGWIKAAPAALGSSALPALAAITPGLQQTGPLDQLGKAALHFSNIEGATGSLGGFDDPAQIDPGTLQHAGDTMLALVRHFGSVPLAHIGDSDRIHFELPLLGQLSYTNQFAWLLTLLTCFVYLVVCGLAVRRSGMALRQLGISALVFITIAAGMALAALTLWQQLPALHASYRPLEDGPGARDHWYVLATITLGSAVFLQAQRWLAKAQGLPAAVLGAKLVMLLGLILCNAVLPGASYLLAWPLLCALLCYGVLYQPHMADRPRWLRLFILWTGMAPAVLLLTPVIVQMATLFTPQHNAMLVLPLAAMLAIGGALLASLRRRLVAPLLLAGCACSLVTASGMPQYAQAPVRPNPLVCEGCGQLHLY